MDDSTNTHQHHLWTQIYSDHLWAVLHHPWQLTAVTPCWTNFYEANVLPCCCIPAFSGQNFWRLVGLAQRTSTAWNKTNETKSCSLLSLSSRGRPFVTSIPIKPLSTPLFNLRSRRILLSTDIVESSLRVLRRLKGCCAAGEFQCNSNEQNHSPAAPQHSIKYAQHTWLTELMCWRSSQSSLQGHGVYCPSSSFTIQGPDSLLSPLISLSCQYSSKVMSHSFLSLFTTRLIGVYGILRWTYTYISLYKVYTVLRWGMLGLWTISWSFPVRTQLLFSTRI